MINKASRIPWDKTSSDHIIDTDQSFRIWMEVEIAKEGGGVTQ